MDPQFQTTFIPKKNLVQSTGKPPHTTNFFTLMATIIMLTVIVVAGGMWGWKLYLKNHNTKLKTELDTNLKQFEPALISELSRLDTRIEASKTLLNQHVALSSFFDFLSDVTLPSVRFSSFKYAITGPKITVTMTGQAQSFGAVALQASEFLKPSNSAVVKNPLFSDLNLDTAGNVQFSFTGTLDPSKISYKAFLNSQAVTNIPTMEASVSTSTATTTTH